VVCYLESIKKIFVYYPDQLHPLESSKNMQQDLTVCLHKPSHTYSKKKNVQNISKYLHIHKVKPKIQIRF